MLSDDLFSLSSWISASRMQVNVKKSSAKWFRIRQSKARVSLPPVYLDGSLLSCVEHHKYLGVHCDPQLSWSSHVGHVCQKMSYYLYLMNYHHRQLPSHILKMLADSLVLSQLIYALPVWGPSLKVNLLSQLYRLYNRAIRITCGLRKYDHVSDSRHSLGWLSLDSLVQHCALSVMYHHNVDQDCVVLNPPLQFGTSHLYDTQTPSYFCYVSRCKTGFGQQLFRTKVTGWWNSLPSSLFDVPRLSDFSCSLHAHLLN